MLCWSWSEEYQVSYLKGMFRDLLYTMQMSWASVCSHAA